MAHQSKALEYTETVNNPAFLMEMRLGKTLCAIRWVKKNLELPCRCLVIAPSTVIGSWTRELTIEDETYVDLTGDKREEKLLKFSLAWSTTKERIWALVNLEGLKVLPEMVGFPWDYVFIDESTKIKNPQAMVSKLCTEPIAIFRDKDKHIIKKCAGGFLNAKHKAILSGMLSPEGYEDIFQQFKFLNGSFMDYRNFWSWRMEYFNKDPLGYGWIPKKDTPVLIKNELKKLAFFMRRVDAGMGKKKVREKVEVELEGDQKKIYNQIEKEFAYEIQGVENDTIWAVVKNTWMHRVAGGFAPKEEVVLSTRKVDAIIDLLKGNLKGEQVVIWFKFRAEVALVRQLLNQEGISTVTIDALNPPHIRTKKREEFLSGWHQVLLATEKIGQFGIDCSSASTAIYYSQEYSCEARVQSEDRILSMVKNEPLLYIDLVSKDTIDEDISEIVFEKANEGRLVMATGSEREFRDAIRHRMQQRLKLKWGSNGSSKS